MFQTQCFNSDIKNLRTSYAFCMFCNWTFILQVTLVDINSSFNSNVDLCFFFVDKQGPNHGLFILSRFITSFFVHDSFRMKQYLKRTLYQFGRLEWLVAIAEIHYRSIQFFSPFSHRNLFQASSLLADCARLSKTLLSIGFVVIASLAKCR